MTNLPRYRFRVPSAFEGVGRLLDMAGSLSDFDYDFRALDSALMYSDFAMVGDDIRRAIEKAAEEEPHAA